jgi:hypothetical protein
VESCLLVSHGTWHPQFTAERDGIKIRKRASTFSNTLRHFSTHEYVMVLFHTWICYGTFPHMNMLWYFSAHEYVTVLFHTWICYVTFPHMNKLRHFSTHEYVTVLFHTWIGYGTFPRMNTLPHFSTHKYVTALFLTWMRSCTFPHMNRLRYFSTHEYVTALFHTWIALYLGRWSKNVSVKRDSILQNITRTLHVVVALCRHNSLSPQIKSRERLEGPG